MSDSHLAFHLSFGCGYFTIQYYKLSDFMNMKTEINNKFRILYFNLFVMVKHNCDYQLEVFALELVPVASFKYNRRHRTLTPST